MLDEERYETDARDWLDSVDVPSPRLEIAQIVQTGRSQARRRRLLGAGGAVAALAALAAIPVTVPLLPSGGGSTVGSGQLPVLDCTMTELPLPDDMPALEPSEVYMTNVVAIDPTGRYILGTVWIGPVELRVTEDGEVTTIGALRDVPVATILWDRGGAGPTRLSNLLGARDVNSDGVVLGEDWLYRDGEVEQLTVPDGYHMVSAESINEAGDVVGSAIAEASRDVALHTAAVKWPASDPDHPELLAQPAPGTRGAWADAVAVLDDGTVLGSITRNGEEDGTPYRWDADGGQHELPLPATAVGGTVGAARGDWAAGFVLVEVPAASFSPSSPSASPPVPSSPADATTASPEPSSGDSEDVFLQHVPARWNLRNGAVEVIDSGNNNGLAGILDISATGDVAIGVPDGMPGPENTGLGVLVRDGTTFALPMPADGFYQPHAISDDGTLIAGSSATEGPAGHLTLAGTPVLWHC